MDKYQVMPPLSDAEYEELKADIAERGVLVAIINAPPYHGIYMRKHIAGIACKS